jgi:hypothetical protein
MTTQLYYSRPLRFEPEGHASGPAIVDAKGQVVAAFFWPAHPPEQTDAAVGELYLIATRAVNAANGIDDDDEGVYQIGKRDGYMDAVQDVDLATGGDGEYKGSTLPGGTVDVPAMLDRVLERFISQAALDAAVAAERERCAKIADDARAAQGDPREAPSPAGAWGRVMMAELIAAAIRSGKAGEQ